jgi:hypothetical protein
MKGLAEKIVEALQSRSVVLVGPSDSGKTYWLQHSFIPYLESQGMTVAYLKDGDAAFSGSPDVVVCDEAETMFDEPATGKYLDKVRRWFAKYSLLPQRTVFVISRNTPKQIKNLIDNMHRADWDDRDIQVLEFKRLIR